MFFDEDYLIGINAAWKLNNTFIIFMMQLGFALMECGAVRGKHINSVLLKNLADVLVGGLVFWCYGYAIAYGESAEGIIGFTREYSGLAWKQTQSEEKQVVFFIHWINQWTIACTCTTIVSGSVAERMKISAYIIYSFVIQTFIYPVAVHWVWNENGWLYKMGFKDFSGVCVVHMIGGLCGGIATTIIKPRHHRFMKVIQKRGNYSHFSRGSYNFQPNNVPFIVIGTLFIWFAWFGFNCGTIVNITKQENIKTIGLVALNTILSASSGALTCVLWTSYQDSKRPKDDKFSEQVYNTRVSMGILSGLVSITGTCNNIEPLLSLIVGVIGATNYLCLSKKLVDLEIDDPLDACPVHFGCGLWGTIATGIFNNDGIVGGDFKLFSIQLLGIICIVCYTSFIALICLLPLSYLKAIRITQEEDSNKHIVIYNQFERMRKKPVNQLADIKEGH